MRNILYPFQIVLLVGVIAVAGRPEMAAMRWSGTVAELTVAAGQEKTTVEFAFRNDGARPLRFVTLRPSCDCLTARASKEVFAPGESGVVKVEFTVGGRIGRQEKFVTVTTDDPAEKPVSLLIVVEIPEPVAVQPRQLFWEKAAAAAEKTVAIALAQPGKDSRVEAQCADERFAVTVEPAAGAGAYRLRVRPVTTAELAQATVRVTVWMAGEGHPQVLVIVVGVR